jgi:sugar phosphate isomerase/epimerase
MRFSIGTWAYAFGTSKENSVDFATILQRLRAIGLDGIELGAFPPHPDADSHAAPAERQALRQQVKDHGLEFSGLAANLWRHKVISEPDNAPYLAAFGKNLDFAHDLGIDCIRVDTLEPPEVFAKTGTEPNVGRQRLVKTWDKCAKRAADRGIRVAWEFEPGFAFNKPLEIVGVVAEVRSLANPNFGVLYDTGHAHACAALGAGQAQPQETLAGGAIEFLQLLKEKIVHIHLSDVDGSPPDPVPLGKGVLDWNRLIPKIVNAGAPSDWWCIDQCIWPQPWEATADAKRFLQPLRKKYAAQKT